MAAGEVSHAYLLCGPEGIGKEHLATKLAQALACEEPSPPCGTCSNCRRVMAGEHPDVRVIRGTDSAISIDQVRELRKFLSLTPFQASRRIALLLDFDDASTEASNALLKSLEEPPAHSILILTATSPQAILPTILSRCQVYHLRRIPSANIQTALEARHGVPTSHASVLARLAGGSLSWAVAASSDPSLEKRLSEDIQQAIDLCHHGRAHRLAAAEQIAKRDDIARLLCNWSVLWRDVLLTAAGQEPLVTYQDQQEHLRMMANVYGIQQAAEALRSIEDALDQIDHHVNPRLAIEVMLLRWRRDRQPSS
ncbi:MAG: DNA polymerase III subunit delta' [Anaerolineae bacterium]